MLTPPNIQLYGDLISLFCFSLLRASVAAWFNIELMTLLVAGHETTASSLAWALYWIDQLPQVREKLLKELESLGDNPDRVRSPTYPI